MSDIILKGNIEIKATSIKKPVTKVERQLKNTQHHIVAAKKIEGKLKRHLEAVEAHKNRSTVHRMNRKRSGLSPIQAEYHRQMEKYHLKQHRHHETSGKHLAGILDSIKKI